MGRGVFAAALLAALWTAACAAAGERGVLFVNVGGALGESEFAAAAGKVAGVVPCGVATAAAERLPELMRGGGGGATLAVYVVRDAAMPGVVSSPRRWAVANLVGDDDGAPDAGALAERRAKALLRGLAFACGAGATIEERCLMYGGRGGGPADLDSAPFAISPMAWLPTLEALDAIFGEEGAGAE